jgi:uncharacterized protein
MQEDRLQVFFSLVKLILVVLVGFFLSNLLALLAVIPFVGFDLELIAKLLENPMNFPETRTALMVMQGAAALGIFVITPIIYLKFLDDTLSFNDLFKNKAIYSVVLLFLTVMMTIVEMPAITWIGKINEGIAFPEFMSGFENWAKVQEDKMKELTIFLTEFRSFGQFLIGFVVIAILPGIGEELLFRGIIQNKIKQLAGNVHIAIWVSAIIFSAFHLQFYGFLPRMLLGALFGYLYYWSGNLLYAIVAHFVNNGFTIVMMYLYQQNKVDLDIEGQETPMDVALLSCVLTILLLFAFYKIVRQKSIQKENNQIVKHSD